MPLKILFLDDEPEIVDLFVASYSSAEVTVLAFTDPELAIAEANREAPDLIFLDYRMPATSGDQVARRMPASVDKFLLTGEISPKLEYAFVEILQKPFVDQRISELISERLSRR